MEYLGFNTHPPYKWVVPSGKTKYDLRLSGVGSNMFLDIINPCIKRGENHV